MQVYKSLIPDLQFLTRLYFGHVIYIDKRGLTDILYSTKQNFKKSKAEDCIFVSYEITSINHGKNPDIPKLLNCTGIPKIKTHTLAYMFAGSQFNGDISQWGTSNVTNMRWMFQNSLFNKDISQWNTSNVTDMSWMFAHTQFNGDISQWDTSNVANMNRIFAHSRFNGDISAWNMSNVTNMNGLFAGSQFNGDISAWDTSRVTDMSYMFAHSQFNQDISQWNTSLVTDMGFMFYRSQFNQDISKWDVSNMWLAIGMFCGSKKITKETVIAWGNFSHLNINGLF